MERGEYIRLSDNIKDFGKAKVVDYPVQNEIYQRLRGVINEYDGELSLSAMIGLLRIIEHDLISDNE